MVCCGPNLQRRLQTSKVLFSSLKRRNYFFGTSNGKKKHHVTSSFSKFIHKQCLNFSYIRYDPLKPRRFTTFKLDRVPHFVIEDIWISKFLRCVTLQWKPEKHLAKVRRTVIVQVFANWIVFALEEVLHSMCQNSRVIVFRFYSKTQLIFDANHQYLGALRMEY